MQRRLRVVLFDGLGHRLTLIRGAGQPPKSILVTSTCAIPCLDDTAFEGSALTSSLPVLVHVVERGCHGCELVKRCFADVLDRCPGHVRCYCVHAAASPVVTARYLVGQFPTILLFRDGRGIRRLVGHPLPGELEVILRTAVPLPPAKVQPH